MGSVLNNGMLVAAFCNWCLNMSTSAGLAYLRSCWSSEGYHVATITNSWEHRFDFTVFGLRIAQTGTERCFSLLYHSHWHFLTPQIVLKGRSNLFVCWGGGGRDHAISFSRTSQNITKLVASFWVISDWILFKTARVGGGEGIVLPDYDGKT